MTNGLGDVQVVAPSKAFAMDHGLKVKVTDSTI